jgi:N-acetylglutamate synthase
MLGPQDVGFRVVVRHIVGVRDGRPLLTDSLGELLRFTDADLTVDCRTGPVTVPMKAVVAGKRIPPRPAPIGGPPDAA